MLMTPHYWQLFASQQTGKLLLPPNSDLARMLEWSNHWCMMLTLNKTKALVVSRSRTVNAPHGGLVLSGVCICASPNHDILGMKFASRLTFKVHVCGIVSGVSQRIGI